MFARALSIRTHLQALIGFAPDARLAMPPPKKKAESPTVDHRRLDTNTDHHGQHLVRLRLHLPALAFAKAQRCCAASNVERPLLDALRETLAVARRSGFCVGYFDPRGWRLLHDTIGRWAGGEGECCRLLVGTPRPPQDDLRALFRLDGNDNSTALRLERRIVEELL